MATTTAQSYSNHARFYPPWHFIAFPVLAINVIVCIVALFLHGLTLGSVWDLVVAIALVLAVFTARSMCIMLQNRLIRLEERLRLQAILPPDLASAADTLTVGQLVGLRFAADTEVEALTRRIVDGELTGQKQIKQAIQHWRADHLRV